MGSDIEQHNFFSGYSSSQSNTVGMSQADGMQSFQFPFESMQAERGLKRIGFQSSENFGELFFLFGVSSRELGPSPFEIALRPRSCLSGWWPRNRVSFAVVVVDDTGLQNSPG